MRIPLVAAAFFVCTAAASAQTAPAASAPTTPPTATPPSPEMRAARKAMRDACAADIKTYCADVAEGAGRIGQCFRAHAADLSSTCKDAVRNLRSERRGQLGGPVAPGG